MGCLFRLGCLALLAIAALTGWIFRDRIMAIVRDEPPAVAAPTWERLTPRGAERTRTALQQLSRRDGPVFASLSGGDVASYVFLELARVMPSLADSAQAAVIDDRLVIRGSVPLRELGGRAVLGPFAGLLGDREPVEIGGRLRVTAPGQGELVVTDMKIREFKLPEGIIPRLLRQSGIERPAGMHENAIPVRLPQHVGDLRVADGRITLYKNVQ